MKVYLVVGTSGHYEDANCWVAKVVTSQEQAIAHSNNLNRWVKENTIQPKDWRDPEIFPKRHPMDPKFIPGEEPSYDIEGPYTVEA